MSASVATNGLTNGVHEVNGTKKAAPTSRAALKRQKKKAKKAAGQASASESESELSSAAEDAEPEQPSLARSKLPSIVDEILAEVRDDEDMSDAPGLAQFKDVFAKFKAEIEETPEEGDGADQGPAKGQVIYSDDDASSEGSSNEGEKAAPAISKRKLRKATRLSVAELKRLVKRPEVVEWVDVTAADPRLLVCLKSYRNAIPIPQHWSAKRDYLQGKRGIEKPPFQLPSYIADTGIGIQREAVKEKEEGQSLKQKTRERVQPKMGKIDIDYQKLHDAFFKYQVPGKMTLFGEMYYEGKEFETDLRNKRPGELSKELIEALSIPPLAPPPWLIAMQRFGPPPSYPQLKIQGLNCPIPEGAQWGFHPGGWGKPPVDEYMRPLYGDVFGVNTQNNTDYNADQGLPIETEPWGELEPDEESDEEEEEEEEDEEMEEASAPGDGLQTPAGGLITPSGMASTASTVPGGLETPDFMDLRKKREGTESVAPENERRDLYTVVQEKRGAPGSGGFLGSERTYDLSAMANTAQPVGILGQEDRGSGKRKANSGVELALDPSELEGMTEQELRQRYEASKNRAAQSGAGAAGQAGREDFSDFVADEVAKRKARSQKKEGGSSRSSREKEKFKF